jgi:hypothetical protein
VGAVGDDGAEDAEEVGFGGRDEVFVDHHARGRGKCGGRVGAGGEEEA